MVVATVTRPTEGHTLGCRNVMLRNTFFVAVAVTIQVPNAEPLDKYDRGWRPMSSEEAFRRFRINMQKPVVGKYPWTSTGDPNDVITLKNDALKIVQPVEMFTGFKGNKRYEDSKINIADKERREHIENHTEMDEIEDNENTTFHEQTSTTEKNYVRIAKKISEHTFGKLVPNLINELRNNSNEVAKSSYKVTEIIDTEELLSSDQNLFTKTGYTYDQPNINNSENTKENLTNKFIKILSKYIVKDMNDNKNYVISREPRIEKLKSKDELIFVPMRLKLINSANNFNHLPVNPVLAVILSNYGFYLPGSYGRQNGYKNLYGYLASNNIHNNKPFGMYKVFSDTDSSN